MANYQIVTEFKKFYLRRNTEFWLRLAIIVGVFLVSIYMAQRAARGGNPISVITHPFLLLIPVAVVTLVFLRRPALGLVITIIASMVVHYEIGTGTGTRLNPAVLLPAMLLGLWLFHMLVYERKIRLAASRTVAPLVVFMIVSILAFISGQLPWFVYAQQASIAAQAGGLALFLLSAGAILLMANQVRDLRWLQVMTWVFLLLGGIYVAGQLLPGMRGFVERLLHRGIYTSSIFWLWLVVLSFSQAFFNRDLHKGWRLALVVLTAGALYISMIRLSSWASGWVPAVAALAVIVWFGAPRWGLVMTLAAGVLALFQLDNVNSFVMSGDNEYSLMTRLEAWRILGEIIRVNPILGVGHANYYWYTPLFSILGWYVQFNSHNNFVDIIAQTGMLGLISFMWIFAELGWLGWRLRTRVPAGFAKAFLIGAVGGLAGTMAAAMLGDWVLPFIYNVGYPGFRASIIGWLFMGGLVVLEQIYLRKTALD